MVQRKRNCCPVYSAPYPNGKKLGSKAKPRIVWAGGSAGKITDTHRGNTYFAVYCPAVGGWINAWCATNHRGVATRHGVWHASLYPASRTEAPVAIFPAEGTPGASAGTPT